MPNDIFGVTADGQPVTRHVLARGTLRVHIIDFGAVVTAIEVPDRDGRSANVVLGLDTLAGYETVSPSFGAVVGRYANRIAGGRFSLDGRTYRLPVNERVSLVAGGRIENFSGAANAGSPLFRREWNASVVAGVAVALWRSEARVDVAAQPFD
jgi:hypothetical protein